MHEIDRKAVAERLKGFLQQRFGTINAAGTALGTSGDSLRNSYLNAKSLPGAEILGAIGRLGCDIDWLLYGSPEDEARAAGRQRAREFRVEATIPAGLAEVVNHTEWYEGDVLDYSPDDHVFLKIDEEFGYSMMPLVQPGDLVLISFTAPVLNGDLVAARWDATRGALKICNTPPGDGAFIILTSYNQAIPPVVLKRREVKMYKVVLIKKKGRGR